MNKYFAYTPAMLAVVFFNNVKAQNYDKQIDALQNELLKMKQEMNNGSDKSKAYFKKGKGLSIKSNDGKYSFQIKGRLMYDIAQLLMPRKLLMVYHQIIQVVLQTIQKVSDQNLEELDLHLKVK